MNEAELRILKLIEEGKISADEGARLISALTEKNSGPKQKGKIIKIKFTDRSTGKTKFHFSIPLEIAQFINGILPRMELMKLEDQGIYLNKILEGVAEGTVGKIFDHNDGKSTDHIEIWIE